MLFKKKKNKKPHELFNTVKSFPNADGLPKFEFDVCVVAKYITKWTKYTLIMLIV